jgi:hypothetical protein
MTTPTFAPLTKDEAMTEQYFHQPASCVYTVGPRGGITRKPVEVRRNGKTKTWKRSPDRFALPVKYGLYVYDTITENDVAGFCPASRCPVCHPETQS